MTEDEYKTALDALMRRVLARLALLSDGKTSSPVMSAGGSEGNEKGSSTISHSKGTGSPSPILRMGPQDWGWEIRSLKNRYGRAHKLDSKRYLIAEALTTLIRAKHSSDPKNQFNSKEWRKKVGSDSRPAHKLAIIYGISRQEVYRCREMAKRNGLRSAA